MSKWKQIETYKEAIKLREGRFVMTPDQAQMVLDLKKKELQKSKYLSVLDISAAEVKKLAKKDRSIEKVIGKLGGSFRVNLLKSKADEKTGAVGGYRQMKSRTPAQLRALRKQMGIKAWDEDAPTNSVASGGVDMNPTGLSMKKKRELDARTKEYRLHRRKLEAQRERRKLKAQKNLCGSFRKNVKENTDNFVREEFIQEDNVAILRKIVKDKKNMPVKLKDGQMKVDLYTASALVQTLDKIKKPDTKKKLEFIINKGNKTQFLRTVDVVFK